jgi:hypothetical protein
VPSTLGFDMIYDSSSPLSDYFAFGISNSVYTFDSGQIPPAMQMPTYTTSITDGIPGQSADSALGMISAFGYHQYYLDATMNLIDPSGEFIGPNGDGDPSNVQINMHYLYEVENTMGPVQTVIVQFETIPEPSSMVLMASGTLLALAVAFGRARRANHSETIRHAQRACHPEAGGRRSVCP